MCNGLGFFFCIIIVFLFLVDRIKRHKEYINRRDDKRSQIRRKILKNLAKIEGKGKEPAIWKEE